VSSSPLQILFEDDTFVFVNKSPDIVVQRGYDADEPVLHELVSAYLAAKNERAFLMQRLDRGTSGVMFFTKREDANPRVTRQFEKKMIRKTYVALLHEKLAQPQIVDAPLLRIGPISFGVRDGGKRAVTEFAPLAISEAATFARVALYTGRTHQIRVHAAAIGHALVGDWLYGARDAARPMLHALRLEMRHPFTGESLQIEAPLPQDFTNEAVARGLRYELVQPLQRAGSE
jgi:23S rRNA pseudouridine1911/1915/1917 synthase